ncbi:MAG: hypothetical protein JSV68_23235 [Anaerolineaceae bacterium]|nr:MAG: hypothetical protein JSV68_23235 [Anaerolineaceae bacterium]
MHCGKQPFLHDDLEDIKLPEKLITKPPLELWLEVVARVAVPEDVVELVNQPLQ